MAPQYDIGIIGSGILGTSLAHQLSRTGEDKRIALFDRDFIGSGCSRYAGAILSPVNLTPMHQVRSEMSRRWYADFAALRPDLFRQLQTFYVCHSGGVDVLKQKDPELMASFNHSQTRPPPPLPGWLKVPAQQQLLKGGDTLWGNAQEVCKHFADNAYYTSVYECSEVTEYHKCADHWQLQLADGRQFSVSQLVLAKGAWLQASEQGHDLITNNKKIVAYIIEAPVPADAPLIYLYDHGAFLLPMQHSQKWIMSITSQQWGVAPGNDTCQADARDLLMAETLLDSYAPQLKDKLRGARVHCDGYLSTRCPEVVKSQSGALIMGGGSGSGFRYAPWVARAATELLLGDKISISGTLTSND